MRDYMDTDEAVEQIMDAAFGAGYISPASAAVFDAATKLIEMIRPVNVSTAARLIANICTAMRDDCEH